MPEHLLVVPVCADALRLSADRLMLDAMAQFPRLPFLDRLLRREVNARTAHLSEEVVAQPFQNTNLFLKAGIHLHWALPDALTHGIHEDNVTRFPAVPNRWLVRRSGAAKIRQWIVESDYLYPAKYRRPEVWQDDAANMPGAAQGGVPYYLPDKEAYDQPFRFLGRTRTFEQWLDDPEPAAADYLRADLTAVGYGEPTFAAFYPNCASVFGFHDNDADALAAGSLRYDVLGWYSEVGIDPLAQFVSEHAESQTLLDAIEEEFEWQVFGAESAGAPRHILCCAAIDLRRDDESPRPSKDSAAGPIKLAVGNTSSEALSALLATELAAELLSNVADDADRERLEDQLESLYLGTELEDSRLDVGQRFREKRHAQSFDPVGGAVTWRLEIAGGPESVAGQEVDANDADTRARFVPPRATATLLDEVNRCQSQLDRTLQRIESLQQELFKDWYKYMLSAYHPQDANRKDDYPDIDEIRYFIELQDLRPLRQAMRTVDQLESSLREAILLLKEAVSEFNRPPTAVSIGGAPQPVQPDCTVSLQVASAAPGREQVILTIRRPGETGPVLLIRISANGRIVALVDGRSLDCSVSVTDNRPHHIAVALAKEGDRTRALIFVDGERKLAIDGVDLAGANLEIAAQFQGELHGGLLDNRVLSAPELQRDIYGLQRLNLRDTQSPGARFWQPSEPVLLMAGPGVDATHRHGHDSENEAGALACRSIEADDDPREIMRDGNRVNDLLQRAIGPLTAHVSTGNSWNPLLMEWDVEVFPVQSRSNVRAVHGGYHPDVVSENYELKDDAVELTVRAARHAITKAANSYTSTCLLSQHAGGLLKERIEDYLTRHLFDDERPIDTTEDKYREAVDTWRSRQPDELYDPPRPEFGFRLRTAAILQWYDDKPADPYRQDPSIRFRGLAPEKRMDDPIYIALKAYERLFDQQGRPRCFLNQTLGGFNDELLMRKRTLQLPVVDPMGFDVYQSFTDEVRALVGPNCDSAPETLNQFNPIRTGAIKLRNVRLIDNFGQTLDVSCRSVITSHRLTLPRSPDLIWLPPRFVQPARLHFRWLAGYRRLGEMTSHPASSPICGWIVPNHFDESLAIYDQSGESLGWIQAANEQGEPRPVRWLPAPGRRRQPDQIASGPLRKVVQHVLNQDARHLSKLIAAIELALERIEPDSGSRVEGLSLMMSRPLAVVRASLDLHLYGRPAINHSWTAFRYDMHRLSRETDNFTHVRIPIRLGDNKLWNDGLVGYWKELTPPKREDAAGLRAPTISLPDRDDDYQLEEGICYVSAADPNGMVDHQLVRMHDPGAPQRSWQSLDDPPQNLTFLIDPRGVVHATCGLLPSKAIDIPTEHYQAALRNIQVAFQSGPMITPQGERQIPLPIEPGFAWSWREHKTEVDRDEFSEAFGANGQAICEHLQRSDVGWLRKAEDGTSKTRTVPIGRRPQTDGLEGIAPGFAESLGREQFELEDGIERLFWRDVNPYPTVTRQAFLQSWTTRLWQHLNSSGIGWLDGQEDHSAAKIVAENQRTARRLQPAWDWYGEELSLLLQGAERPLQSTQFHRLTVHKAAELWEYLLRDEIGWLRQSDAGQNNVVRAEVVARDQRPAQALTGHWQTAESEIEFILRAAHLIVKQPVPQASLDGRRQEIREGWILLGRAAESDAE